ncbi:unnamed protein product [Enterobius vermicularis]|uniref:Uncharacterized protein n=1 Tax=Enterobius vermicularis TaxID=51028 RepID=A0A0N4V126_ENTVE|nr:unnamed protein product [Enterobius vermicularis]
MENLESFMQYLGNDGILVFRLMAHNAGDIVSSIIAARLFSIHLSSPSRTYKQNRRHNPYSTYPEICIPSLKRDLSMEPDFLTNFSTVVEKPVK